MEIYKEIFEAAKEYGFSTFGDSFFKDRAKWEAEHPQGLNDVWHKGSEEPQNNRLLLILFENDEICYFCNINRQTWHIIKDYKNIVCWGYVDDLLPNRKED